MTLCIVGTDAALAEIQDAIAKSDGMPRRGTVVGGPDYLPKDYYPGAPGWTERIADTIDTDDGKRALEVAPEYRKYLGKTVRAGAKDVVLPAESALVEAKKKDPKP